MKCDANSAPKSSHQPAAPAPVPLPWVLMKTITRITLCLVLVLGLTSWNAAQEKAESQITILVPPAGQEETVVKVNGKLLDGEGGTRVFKEKLEKGKDYK